MNGMAQGKVNPESRWKTVLHFPLSGGFFCAITSRLKPTLSIKSHKQLSQDNLVEFVDQDPH
jgi:hypothetical protein